MIGIWLAELRFFVLQTARGFATQTTATNNHPEATSQLAVTSAALESAAPREAQRLGDEVGWLRIVLRKHPGWVRGHLELGSRAVKSADCLTAYASAQAALTLTEGSEHQHRLAARLLLARTLLRQGSFARATEQLQAILQGAPSHIEAIEELAAAKLALQDPAEAIRLLESIPQAQRSAEGTTALEYARSRVVR